MQKSNKRRTGRDRGAHVEFVKQRGTEQMCDVRKSSPYPNSFQQLFHSTSHRSTVVYVLMSAGGEVEKEKGVSRWSKEGNKVLDAPLLPTEEPSARSLVPVQLQRPALIPPPARAGRTPVFSAVRWGAPWLRTRDPCARARVPTDSVL